MTEANDEVFGRYNYPDITFVPGLTKREYFAAMAMQGFCARHDVVFNEIPESAVMLADRLIAELNK